MEHQREFFPRIVGSILCAYGLCALILSAGHYVGLQAWTVSIVLDTLFLPMPVSSLAWSVALLALGRGLYTAKRAAWTISIAGLALLNLGNVLYALFLLPTAPHPGITRELFYWGAAVQLCLLLLMLWQRRSFAAATVRGAILRALAVWLGGTVVVFLLGLALVNSFPGTLDQQGSHAKVVWAISHSAAFSLVTTAFHSGIAPWFVTMVVSLLSMLVLVAAGFVLLRSQRDENVIGAGDERALRALIERFNGNDSLAYFATRRDKSVVFEPNGRAAVTYRVEAGVCLASADPIGDPLYWDDAVSAWLRRAVDHGWVPAAIGASERGARVFEKYGLHSIRLGDEAVIDAADFHISELKEVRQARAHALKHGIQVRVRRHEELSRVEMQEVQRRVDSWRDTTDERGFSMALGRLGDPLDSRCLLVEALVGDKPVGLLSFVPWGPAGVSLDLMRRSPDAPNGTVETMVAELCGDESIRKVSLNFAVFRTLFASENQVAVSPARHTARRILAYLSRWWQMETLYRSNQKYDPLWVPRYLSFPSSLSLAQVAMAAGIAEGFLPQIGQTDRRRNADIDQPEVVLALEHAGRASARQKKTDSEQAAVRVAKAKRMIAAGLDPWPEAVRPTHSSVAALECDREEKVRVAGRVTARRDFGGVLFLDVRDAEGMIQVIVEQDVSAVRPDLGDLLAVTGTIGYSRAGQKSLLAETVTTEAKALHPLQGRGRGIAETNQMLRTRAKTLHSFRTVLEEEGYLEVETPILQPVHGGANARPFITHINAYNQELYLRIAPELYLKRLLCAGAERIFELGRVFRNEGVDATHNPEFTVLEAYDAHGDYDSMRLLTQRLIQRAAKAVNGVEAVPGPDREMVSIAGDWPVKTVHAAVSEKASELLGTEVAISPSTNRDDLVPLAETLGIALKPSWDTGEIVLELYEHLVEATTKEPTFYINFPTSVSPLTRKHRSIVGVTERWDLVAWGVELGTAYSELTDPLEQRRRLEAQSLKASGGDPEAMEVDEAFLTALENGMPPTGGLGIGVDRIIMLLSGRSIREVVAFPLTS